ncbi:MAG: hypothetical protein HY238_01150 [Acidobacteria bacterium]|nr:hypothetical protein [Acidobacteriota bacterium]
MCIRFVLGWMLAAALSEGVLRAQAPQVGGGVIRTVAGTGTSGFSGDGGPGDRALLNLPLGSQFEEFGHIAVDASGNLFIADKGNHRIRKLDANGVITTVAGTGVPGFSGDGGPATRAQINSPTGITVDRAGNVYFTDQENDRVRKIDASGIISTVAGNGTLGFSGDGGPATRASLGEPSAVAVDAVGNLYIADYLNDRVRRVAAQTGVITTVAGNGSHGDDDPGMDGVPATSIRLGFPSAVLVDAAGNLFIADHHSSAIRVVNLQTGLIRRVAGTARHAGGIPLGDGGPAAEAVLDWPVGMALDAAGNLYFADMHNDVIRRVSSPLTPGAVINTAVGRAGHGFSGDGGPASEALLDYPTGVAIDSNANLFIADWHNQRVRKATPGASAQGPEIFQGGLVNGASFAPAPARVAPGSLVSIFGQSLAAVQAVATVAPLPTTLPETGGTSVRVIAGPSTFQMPLFFVSSGQINAQLPVEVPAGGPATVVVKVGEQESAPLTINVSVAEAGIFTYGDNRAVAVNQDGKLNGPGDAAPRGTVITVYLTGQGELRPAVPTGRPAPQDVLSRSAFDVSATIGGVPARVEFLGATPGFVALSQANITVPESAPTGDQPLVIDVAGHTSNRAVITIR